LVWYEVFAYLKSAIIAQQLYKRFLDGHTKDERMKRFGQSVKAIVNLTTRIIGEKPI